MIVQPLAFFAASDDQYIPKAAMALRSFQRWHPECGYFVLGPKAAMSSQSLEFLRRYSIQLLDVDESRRFVKQGRRKDKYPTECFYLFKGPELLAEHGFTYSISVDGDVFCARPLDLETVLNSIEGFAARPVGTLGRTLSFKQQEKNQEFDFSFERVRDMLGLQEGLLKTRYEVNTGVVFWNNISMAKLGLFEKATRVFELCQGCFEGDQDLLGFTAATFDIPFFELGDLYNFSFFEDSHLKIDDRLQEQVRRGLFEDISIVHFVFSKPWLTTKSRSAVKVHFINAWREFVLNELGEKAYDIFDDLSFIRSLSSTTRVWSLVRRIWSKLDG